VFPRAPPPPGLLLNIFNINKQGVPQPWRYKKKFRIIGGWSGGPKLYILNKIKDTSYLALLLIGQGNNILSLQTLPSPQGSLSPTLPAGWYISPHAA